MKKNGFTVRASVLIYVIAAFLAGTIASTFLNAKGEETGIHVIQTATVTKGMAGDELVDMEALAEAGAAGFTTTGAVCCVSVTCSLPSVSADSSVLTGSPVLPC